LVASSLIANCLQPATLTQLPVLAATAFALCGFGARLPLALFGLGMSLAFMLVTAQAAGLVWHGLARNRRFRDVALVFGLGLSFALSLLPLLVLAGGARSLRGLLFGASALEWLPFAWGARAAVHASRGELLPFLGFGTAAAVALLGAGAVCGFLIKLVYEGELDLGSVRSDSRAGATMRLPGPLGALIEKDLRSAWRDPGLRATLILGLLGPALVLFFLTRSPLPGQSAGAVLVLASFVGLSAFGSNTLGYERRGLPLLLGFPIERWRVLVGKNLAALLFRLPGLLTLLAAAAFTAPLRLAPAAVVILAATFLIAVGVDNYFAILFPVAVPAAGKNPYAQASGGRGLGAAVVSAVFLLGALLASAPFALLAWLPLLLRTPWLWFVSLPLALAGALATYAMLVAGAARLLERREPELVARVLGEA
jgi:hypothetical protein